MRGADRDDHRREQPVARQDVHQYRRNHAADDGADNPVVAALLGDAVAGAHDQHRRQQHPAAMQHVRQEERDGVTAAHRQRQADGVAQHRRGQRHLRQQQPRIHALDLPEEREVHLRQFRRRIRGRVDHFGQPSEARNRLREFVPGGAERGQFQWFAATRRRVLEATDLVADRLQLAFVPGEGHDRARRHQRQCQFLGIFGDVGRQRTQATHEMMVDGLAQRLDVGIAGEDEVETVEQNDQRGHPPHAVRCPRTEEDHVACRLQPFDENRMRFDEGLLRQPRARLRIVEVRFRRGIGAEGPYGFAEEQPSIAVVENGAHQQGVAGIADPARSEDCRMPQHGNGAGHRHAEQQRQHRRDAKSDGAPPVSRNQPRHEAHSRDKQPHQPGRTLGEDGQDGQRRGSPDRQGEHPRLDRLRARLVHHAGAQRPDGGLDGYVAAEEQGRA